MTIPRPPITGAVPDTSLVAIRTSALNCEIIKKFTVCNVSANPADLSVSIKPSGGTARAVVKAKTLQPNESYECYAAEGHSLGTGDALQALTSVASALEYALTIISTS